MGAIEKELWIEWRGKEDRKGKCAARGKKRERRKNTKPEGFMMID
jgi:hypothetical protein